MAISYTESANLMKDGDFQGRVKVACLTYAAYISNESPDVVGHNTRYKWAIATLTNPDLAAFNITPTAVMDPNVQAQGAAIDDATLQTAVETALNKVM